MPYIRIVGLAALAVSAAACTRTHLSRSHGQSYRAAFAHQARPVSKMTGPVAGLDSQEAIIVSETYRRGFAHKDTENKEAPILLVAPPTQSTGYEPQLAPSVPKAR